MFDGTVLLSLSLQCGDVPWIAVLNYARDFMTKASNGGSGIPFLKA
jgi:hypothetical protein